jgi:hypothetical protein
MRPIRQSTRLTVLVCPIGAALRQARCLHQLHRDHMRPLAGAFSSDWHGAMNSKWYYSEGGGDRYGPIPLEDLGHVLASKNDSRNFLVWSPGMSDWTRAGDIPDLKRYFQQHSPQNSDNQGQFNHGRREHKGRVGRWFAELYFLRSLFGYCLIGAAIAAAKLADEEDRRLLSFLAFGLCVVAFEMIVNVLIDKKIAAAKQEIPDKPPMTIMTFLRQAWGLVLVIAFALAWVLLLLRAKD